MVQATPTNIVHPVNATKVIKPKSKAKTPRLLGKAKHTIRVKKTVKAEAVKKPKPKVIHPLPQVAKPILTLPAMPAMGEKATLTAASPIPQPAVATTVPLVKPAVVEKHRQKAPRSLPKIDTPTVQTRWQEVQVAVGPTKLLRLAEQFDRDYPFSAVSQQNQALQACAQKTLEIARSAGISSDFFDEIVDDANYNSRLRSAVRGDKEAAYQLALAYQTANSGVTANALRAEQWLRFAADLGHGRASWEVAEIYNRAGLMADAARYERKATEQGYVLPTRLPNRGY